MPRLSRKQWTVSAAVVAAATSVIIVVIIIVHALSSSNKPAKAKLVIDNDAGGDDAMAIFLALLYEKHFDGPQIVGLTTGNGNAIEDSVYVNNQRILKVAKRQDIPIYRGTKFPLLKSPERYAWYGEDGLGDTGEVVDGLVPAKEQHAVNALIELSKLYKGNLTVVTIGTLTNLAMAIRMDPDFLGRLAHLYVGAGHIQSEDHPKAEFNAFMDVVAYDIVMQHATPDQVTVIPFSQIQKYCNMTREWREEVLGGLDNDIMRAQNKYESVSIPKNQFWHSLDPAVMAVLLRPDLVEEYKYSKSDIVICGEKRGLTNNNFVNKSEANTRLVYSVKKEEYRQFLLDVFSKGGQ